MTDSHYRLFLTLERHGGEPEPLQVGILGNLSEEEAAIVRESRITRDVTAALWRKQIAGAKEHGCVMQPFDGRVDALTEAMQECLDLAQYLMKMRLEHGTAYPKAYDDMSQFRQEGPGGQEEKPGG